MRSLSTVQCDSTTILGLNSGFVFQQDNAPCHKSKHAMQIREINKITLNDCHAQSTHLNLIENVWAFMKK